MARREVLKQWAGCEGLRQLLRVESGAVATQSGDASQFFPEVDVVGLQDSRGHVSAQQRLPCGGGVQAQRGHRADSGDYHVVRSLISPESQHSIT